MKDLCSKEYKVSYFEVDVSNKDQCVAMVKAVANANNGNVHLLVNCAVYFAPKV